MIKRIKNLLLLSLIIIETLTLTNVSSFALCYSSKTNGEEIHQRSCADAFQATGLLAVSFEDHDGTVLGTATLIAPDVLITAAHNLVKPGQRIEEISFLPECDPPSADRDYVIERPKNVWIHPDYDYESHDIAIIQLAQPFKNIRPAQLQKELPDDFVSAQTTVVGYGYSGSNSEGPIFNDYKRRAGHMELFSDFSQKGILYMPYTPKNENEGGGFIDSCDGSKYATIVVNGDSGGPAFIEIKGKPSARIVGIAVADIKKCTLDYICGPAKSKFMSIPYYYPWIESKLKLCNYHGSDDDSSIPDYNNEPNSEYVDNQAEIVWGSKKRNALGSQMLDEFIALNKELFE